MSRNRFIDPLTSHEYIWQVNHSSEESDLVSAEVKVIQPTAAGWKPNVKPIFQQGSVGVRHKRLSGMCPTREQHLEFLHFLSVCTTRTIFFEHCIEGAFEALLRSYEPKEESVTRGPRGGTQIWRYTMDIELITSITL